jgi:TPR repeat protein
MRLFFLIAVLTVAIAGAANAQTWTECRQIVGDRFDPAHAGRNDFNPGRYQIVDAIALCLPEYVANQDDPAAATRLARVLLDSENARDRESAVMLLKKAAERQYVPAFYILGFLHQVGRAVAVDRSEARRWYEKAAAAGYPPALSVLAYATYFGEGDPVYHLPGIAADRARGIAMLDEAARLGEPAALHLLGQLHLDPDSGVAAPDYETAIAFMTEAAEMNYGPAQTNLGWRYESTGDKEKARYWYDRAARSGDPNGEILSNLMYQGGPPTSDEIASNGLLALGFLALIAAAANGGADTGGIADDSGFEAPAGGGWPCDMMTATERALAGCPF